MAGTIRRTLQEKFDLYARKNSENECWEWLGKSHNQRGYGLIRHMGHSYQATQLAWMLHNGREFPKGQLACHTCDNPKCVNPHHIWPGTQRDNMADCALKGRLVTPKRKTLCIRGHDISNAPRRKDSKGPICQECQLFYKKARKERRNLTRGASCV